MRVRFEIQSLSALGEGPLRIPVKCWRLTMLYTSARLGSVFVDGADLTEDLLVDPALNVSGLARIVVGGVIINGQPVNLDQVLLITTAANRIARGVLIYEHLEP